jgi:hypothetical protein
MIARPTTNRSQQVYDATSIPPEGGKQNKLRASLSASNPDTVILNSIQDLEAVRSICTPLVLPIITALAQVPRKTHPRVILLAAHPHRSQSRTFIPSSDQYLPIF